ncbi:uncharacterized protein LOC100678869 [Nasonia vitripennis]|uniref:Uncharacterized protein n=1 Tax=Nasonia vitripennis TaxID=7425 RepID=A0A7M7GDP4_NASVI|nr:uncharacterized protein LOC100678869 [Nasonia vitripennis]
MQPYRYTLEEHGELKYKAMAVRGHELEIRQKLAKERPDLSIKKRQEYARMLANYAGLNRYGTFKPLEPYVPPEEPDKNRKKRSENDSTNQSHSMFSHKKV